MTTQEIQHGIASQSFIFDCPDGRPTGTPTVSVFEAIDDDEATAESATSGSASVETNPNTTVDVVSGAGETNPAKIYVAATTGFTVGRRYLITSGLGHKEWFEVVDISSGDHVIARHPLLNSYEVTASTVVSTRCSISVLDSWAADDANVSPALSPNPRYRLRWTVTVNSASQVYDEYADLVRYPARLRVNALDVAERLTNWLDWLGPDDRSTQGRSVINRAWTATKMDLYGDGKADQAIRNVEALREVVIARVVKMTIEDRLLNGGDVSSDQIRAADLIWQQRYDQLIRSPVIAMDTGGDGAAQPIRPSSLTRR